MTSQKLRSVLSSLSAAGSTKKEGTGGREVKMKSTKKKGRGQDIDWYDYWTDEEALFSQAHSSKIKQQELKFMSHEEIVEVVKHLIMIEKRRTNDNQIFTKKSILDVLTLLFLHGS